MQASMVWQQKSPHHHNNRKGITTAALSNQFNERECLDSTGCIED